MNEAQNDLFESVATLPNPSAQGLYGSLVGLEEVKERLSKDAGLLLRPAELVKWSMSHYKKELEITRAIRNRVPLFVFAGDVGTGKTALAETFGDPLARQLGIRVELFKLSLSARGIGAVGQMTALITEAFRQVQQAAHKYKLTDGNPNAAAVLLIDEADALAQSREFNQMHHEDKAGVNALIRGVDGIKSSGLPVIVVMCSNRLQALDPAVLRRATRTFEFIRPNGEQRTALLSRVLDGVGFSKDQIRQIADALGETKQREYGCTYSDITQRLVPDFVFQSFPHKALDFNETLTLAKAFIPTAPFNHERRA